MFLCLIVILLSSQIENYEEYGELLHLPLVNPVDKRKLYRHIPTPGWISKDGYQLLVDGQSEEFVAISSMGTLYATFSSSEL